MKPEIQEFFDAAIMLARKRLHEKLGAAAERYEVDDVSICVNYTPHIDIFVLPCEVPIESSPDRALRLAGHDPRPKAG